MAADQSLLFPKILVCTDGSPASAGAIAAALQIGSEHRESNLPPGSDLFYGGL